MKLKIGKLYLQVNWFAMEPWCLFKLTLWQVVSLPGSGRVDFVSLAHMQVARLVVEAFYVA